MLNNYFEITNNNNVSIKDNIITIKGNNKLYLKQLNNFDKKLIINLEENSNTEIIEEYLNVDLEINLKKNSSLNNYTIVNSNTYNKIVNMFENSILNTLTFNITDGNIKNNTNINLLERKAILNCKTLDISHNKDNHFNKIVVNHLAKETEAYCFNYAIGNDSSKLEFYNVNKINEGMSKSISRQNSKGIIMKDTSKVIIEPTLTIFENDVVANHGATIGKISDEGLFYLMSRGLDKENALNLIIRGFIDPLIKEIKDESYQTNLMNIINKKI